MYIIERAISLSTARIKVFCVLTLGNAFAS
jgi:hypothetical protein